MAGNSNPRTSTTMSMKFDGATTQDLWRQVEKFSGDVGGKIDSCITTERQCPGEMSVSVTRSDGSKTQTNENRMEMSMVDLPDRSTINEFIMGQIEENNVQAAHIESVQVTMRDHEKFGEEVVPFGECLPTTRGSVHNPYDFEAEEYYDNYES